MQTSLASGALWASTVVFSVASSLALPTLSHGEQADSLVPFYRLALSTRSPDQTLPESCCVRYEPASAVRSVRSAAPAPTPARAH